MSSAPSYAFTQSDHSGLVRALRSTAQALGAAEAVSNYLHPTYTALRN